MDERTEALLRASAALVTAAGRGAHPVRAASALAGRVSPSRRGRAARAARRRARRARRRARRSRLPPRRRLRRGPRAPPISNELKRYSRRSAPARRPEDPSPRAIHRFRAPPSLGRSTRSPTSARWSSSAVSRRRDAPIRRSRSCAATSSASSPGPRSDVSSTPSTRSGQRGRSRRARRRSSSRARSPRRGAVSVDLRLASRRSGQPISLSVVRRLLGPFTGTRSRSTPAADGVLAFALAPHVAEVVGVDTRADYLEAGRAASVRRTSVPRGRRHGFRSATRSSTSLAVIASSTTSGAPSSPSRARARHASRREGVHRRPARLDRPARQPRDGPLRAPARRDSPAAPARGRHPRLSSTRTTSCCSARRSRARASTSSSGSSSPGFDEEERAASAGPLRRRRTRSRSAGTSPASRACRRLLVAGAVGARGERRHEPREERLSDRYEPIREPRDGDLRLSFSIA